MDARPRRLLVQATGLVAAYYLVPVGGLPVLELWSRATAALLVLAAVLWFVVRTVAEERHADDDAVRLDRLALAAVAGVVCFALADLAVARMDPGQFDGLETKTDALYFALVTLTTVGFGDVHPAGQIARQVVMVQLAFYVVVLATAARTLARALARRSMRDPERSQE